jgi:hypothetical protein
MQGGYLGRVRGESEVFRRSSKTPSLQVSCGCVFSVTELSNSLTAWSRVSISATTKWNSKPYPVLFEDGWIAAKARKTNGGTELRLAMALVL